MLEKLNTLALVGADALIIGIGVVVLIFGVEELIEDTNWFLG